MPVNKNGIPILDPKRNGLPKQQKACLPGEHKWEDNGYKEINVSLRDRLLLGMEPRFVNVSRCSICGTED